VIKGIDGIREAYQDERTADAYIRERFVQPLGALLHHRQMAALRRIIRRARPHDVLEIAPGPGRLTTEVASLLCRPGTLVDASVPMLAAARARLERATPVRWRYLGGDAFHLPFRSRFDLVYVFRLIRHFEQAERARLYAEIARVLRPGGLLVFDAVNEVVSAPLRARARETVFRHYDALMRPAALRAELAQAGFEVLTLRGAQHRYSVLARIETLVAPRSRFLARAAMEIVDRVGGGEPLEWIVTCRRA
jgi:ubiquinone/menaquinone biosynthesis C-methylase UbiE